LGVVEEYLLLEEANYMLVEQLVMAEEEAKTLKDERSALLNQLVILEGLVETLQLKPHRSCS
jgi:hypothetical protein